MANPETTYTNRIRTKITKMYPDVRVYKHSDRFNGGISDLHMIKSHNDVAWVEVKFLKACARYRKAGVTELQDEFLKEHWERGVPSFVLVGIGKLSVLYRYDRFDGRAYRNDAVTDEEAITQLMVEMEMS